MERGIFRVLIQDHLLLRRARTGKSQESRQWEAKGGRMREGEGVSGLVNVQCVGGLRLGVLHFSLDD